MKWKERDVKMPQRIDRIGMALAIIAMILLTAIVMGGCRDAASESKLTQQEKPMSSLETLTIPAGTRVLASLDTGLSTDTNHSGDAIVATVIEPIVIDGNTIAPSGTKIRGSLLDVQASGRVKGRARMTLAYQQIVDSAGEAHTISAQPLTLQAASETQGDVEKIVAGTILGAVIGGIAGGGKGAAIGAGAGAGAGTVLMLVTEGDDVELNPGQKLYVDISADSTIPVVARR
jgi:hypothetical protein